MNKSARVPASRPTSRHLMTESGWRIGVAINVTAHKGDGRPGFGNATGQRATGHFAHQKAPLFQRPLECIAGAWNSAGPDDKISTRYPHPWLTRLARISLYLGGPPSSASYSLYYILEPFLRRGSCVRTEPSSPHSFESHSCYRPQKPHP